MTIGDGHDLKSSRFSGDEILEACYDNERILRRGDSGSAVKKVQEALIILGIPIPKVGANSIFGDETELAVRSYQEARGLKVDGIIGPETIGSLDEEFHTEPAKEHRVLPSTEPYVSEVPSPLVPESPVRSPRMPPVLAPEPKVPPLKKPRAPKVERPSVKIPRPPVPSVAGVPAHEVHSEKASSRFSKSVETSPAFPPMRTDDQGRKFHSAGTWKENNSFEVEAGKSVHFVITNSSNIESNIGVKANTGEVAQFVIPPRNTVDLEFSMAIKEPFIWRFYIETDSKKVLIDWNLYSTWVPGDQKNP